MTMRVGIGVDTHRLAPGRRLVLGNVEIAGDRGLTGHSDADVLVHAIVDAILGALALGDIGSFFPDDDPTWRDADSRVFLERAVALGEERGFTVCNVDATIMAEAPKLRPYVDRMRAALARTLRVDPSAVSVKATTGEGMGAIGRGEGISCTAVVLMELRQP